MLMEFCGMLTLSEEIDNIFHIKGEIPAGRLLSSHVYWQNIMIKHDMRGNTSYEDHFHQLLIKSYTSNS
jgi:putative heme iron utilization protein